MGAYNKKVSELVVAAFRDNQMSYSQVAEVVYDKLGIKFSRNAIAGYVNRARARGVEIPDKMNVVAADALRKRVEKQRYDNARREEKRAKRLAALAATPAPEPIELPPPPLDPYEGPRGMLAILEKKSAECSWPIGDPRADDFYFCSAPADGAYCEHHKALAYVKPTQYKRANAHRPRGIFSAQFHPMASRAKGA